jgi:hypothetical protein
MPSSREVWPRQGLLSTAMMSTMISASFKGAAAERDR